MPVYRVRVREISHVWCGLPYGIAGGNWAAPMVIKRTKAGSKRQSAEPEDVVPLWLQGQWVTSRSLSSAREYAHKRDMRRAVPNLLRLCS